MNEILRLSFGSLTDKLASNLVIFFLFLEEESISEPFNGKFLLILHCEEIDFQSHLKNNFLTFFLFHRKNVHEPFKKKVKINIKCSWFRNTLLCTIFFQFIIYMNHIVNPTISEQQPGSTHNIVYSKYIKYSEYIILEF